LNLWSVHTTKGSRFVCNRDNVDPRERFTKKLEQRLATDGKRAKRNVSRERREPPERRPQVSLDFRVGADEYTVEAESLEVLETFLKDLPDDLKQALPGLEHGDEIEVSVRTLREPVPERRIER